MMRGAFNIVVVAWVALALVIAGGVVTLLTLELLTRAVSGGAGP